MVAARTPTSRLQAPPKELQGGSGRCRAAVSLSNPPTPGLGARERGVRSSDRGRDEAHEERLRLERAARQFGVVLGADELGVGLDGEFEDLHDWELGMPTRESKAARIEAFDVLRLDFESMTESFPDQGQAAVQETRQ